MAAFPTTESNILMLAETVSSGLEREQTFFENPPVTPDELKALKASVVRAVNACNQFSEQMQQAQKAKDNALAELQGSMKKVLRWAEIKAYNEPLKLKAIDWGPRNRAVRARVPYPPSEIQAVRVGAGKVALRWNKPINSPHRKVLAYAIMRRELVAGGKIQPWRYVGNSFDTAIVLDQQPQGIKLEYTVHATNRAGRSSASNTAEVVL